MKKLLVALALLTVSTLGYAKEVVSSGDGFLYIVDGKKVYFCNWTDCKLVSSDYTMRNTIDTIDEVSDIKDNTEDSIMKFFEIK